MTPQLGPYGQFQNGKNLTIFKIFKIVIQCFMSSLSRGDILFLYCFCPSSSSTFCPGRNLNTLLHYHFKLGTQIGIIVKECTPPPKVFTLTYVVFQGQGFSKKNCSDHNTRFLIQTLNLYYRYMWVVYNLSEPLKKIYLDLMFSFQGQFRKKTYVFIVFISLICFDRRTSNF